MPYTRLEAIQLIQVNLSLLEAVPVELSRPEVMAKVLRVYGLIQEGAYDHYLEEYILRGMCEDSAVRSEAECIYDQLMNYGFMNVTVDPEEEEE